MDIACVDKTLEVLCRIVAGIVVTMSDNVVVSTKKNQNKSFSELSYSLLEI